MEKRSVRTFDKYICVLKQWLLFYYNDNVLSLTAYKFSSYVPYLKSW